MIVKDPRALDPASTDGEMIERMYQVWELIVGGASIKQVADHFGISRDLVRSDVQHVTEELNDREGDRALAIREEILARQRSLILANMPRARAGDKISAMIVQHSDNLIASITGVRYLRVEVDRPRDPAITEAVEAYVHGIADAHK